MAAWNRGSSKASSGYPSHTNDYGNEVLRRDSWRCQSCGSMSNLEVHHRKFRSQGGDDSEVNLITLCIDCHLSLHGSWWIRWKSEAPD